MKPVDNVVRVKINLEDNYTVNWLVVVGNDQQEFIDAIENIGGEDYLEDNRISAIFFDTTPPDKIVTEMQDYNLVRKKYKKSYRVMGQAVYIGSIETEFRKMFVNKFLEHASTSKHEIAWSNIKLEE